MESKTIYNGSGQRMAQEIRIEAHGKGGELGIKNIQYLTGMIESLKACKTPQEVYDRYMMITGYCKCCVNSGFLDEKSADDLMRLAAFLAGNEQARAEHEQKGGKA